MSSIVNLRSPGAMLNVTIAALGDSHVMHVRTCRCVMKCIHGIADARVCGVRRGGATSATSTVRLRPSPGPTHNCPFPQEQLKLPRIDPASRPIFLVLLALVAIRCQWITEGRKTDGAWSETGRFDRWTRRGSGCFPLPRVPPDSQRSAGPRLWWAPLMTALLCECLSFMIWEKVLSVHQTHDAGVRKHRSRITSCSSGATSHIVCPSAQRVLVF